VIRTKISVYQLSKEKNKPTVRIELRVIKSEGKHITNVAIINLDVDWSKMIITLF